MPLPASCCQFSPSPGISPRLSGVLSRSAAAFGVALSCVASAPYPASRPVLPRFRKSAEKIRQKPSLASPAPMGPGWRERVPPFTPRHQYAHGPRSAGRAG